ncbi:MAG: adenylate/guanylate cyclase domain-containing protein [Roseicyclus sp.]
MSAKDAGLPEADPARLEAEIAELIASGQVFRAHDLAEAGQARHPDAIGLALWHALALCQTGAGERARSIVEPIFAAFDTDLSTTAAQAVDALRALLAGGPDGSAVVPHLATLAAVLAQVQGASGPRVELGADRLTRLAEIYLMLWRGSGREADLRKVTVLYTRSMARAPSLQTALGAALAHHFLTDTEAAARFAAAGLAAFADLAEPDFEDAARASVCRLLLGEVAKAEAQLAAAQASLGRPDERTVPFLRLLRDLAARGLEGAGACAGRLEPPRIVVFTGHELDRPGAEAPCFPPALERDLRRAIAEALDQIGATIGYALPRCGSDILFLEALIERDAELNIILPSDTEDFVAHCVAYGGPAWEKRFRKVLRLADSVSHATVEKFLGHEALNRFANQYLHGSALLRARYLETEPYLLAVWDMNEGSLPGGAADFIDQWEDISKLRIIDLDDLSDAAGLMAPAGPALVGEPPPHTGPERGIRSMLFADFVGFSKLEDDDIPDYIALCEALHAEMTATAPAPTAINTWGDAFFVVMEDARSMVVYALAMADGIGRVRTRFQGAVGRLDLRISLHAGPVYGGRDPFRDSQNFYGAHINRAARLEPVTIAGHIYATSQFVALLTVEEASRRHEAGMTGEAYAPFAAADYVGVVSLAKGFGDQAVYHLRKL